MKGKRNILKLILSLPKTIFFNFKVFNFKTAIKLPLLISYNTVLRRCSRGSIVLNNWNGNYRIVFGFGGSDNICSNRKSYVSLISGSKCIFNGGASFCEGNSLSVSSDAIIEFGKNFSSNKNNVFECDKQIRFGNDVLLGWNIHVRDTDGAKHTIYYNREAKSRTKPIVIEDHVWVGSHADILKGTTIKNNSVVAWKSVVTSPFNQENLLIGGIPGKVISNNIHWEGRID